MSITIQIKLRGQKNATTFYLPIEVTGNSFLDCLKELDKLEKDLSSRYISSDLKLEIEFPVRLYDKDEF